MSKMNPDITTAEIGIRSLREITIYPLSVASQLAATEIIVKIVNEVSALEELTDTEVVETFIKLISTSLQDILVFITDPHEQIDFEEVTNLQLQNIAFIVFNQNYKDVVKNSKDLIEKMKPLLTSMRS